MSTLQVLVDGLERLDSTAYASFTDQHSAASAYHNLAWLRATEQAYGHRAYVITAREGERLVGVLPVCHLRRPGGGGPVVSLPFCDHAGPLFENSEAEQALRDGARQLSRHLSVSSIEIRQPGSALSDEQVARLECGGSQRKVSMMAALPDSSAALFKSYKPKLRSQIRKAEKNGLTATIVQGPEGIEDFYPVFAANMRRLGSPVHSKRWFEALQEGYGERLLTGIVSLDTNVVGAGIVLRHRDKACIPWASTLTEYNHLAPNMLLYWSLLSELADSGCRHFDFGRSSFGEGTYRFKKQWGAQPVALEWQQWQAGGGVTELLANEPGKVSRQLRAWVEACWRHLPMSVSVWLGPRLRKHISL